MVNMQREVSSSIPKANQDHDHETKLDDLDHFVALFDRLQQEATTPSYRIGSRSRSRIEKDISDARNREATYLDSIYGEAVMKDAWNTLDQKMSLVTPSIDDHGTQHTDQAESTINSHSPILHRTPLPLLDSSPLPSLSKNHSVSAPPTQLSARLPLSSDTQVCYFPLAENVTEPGPTTATSQQNNRLSTPTAKVPSRIYEADCRPLAPLTSLEDVTDARLSPPASFSTLAAAKESIALTLARETSA